MPQDRPNIVCVFADQLRAQALGYAGDPNVHTPHLDRLARENVNFTNATCCIPICTPARAALLTGRYPLSTQVFMNDMPLSPSETTIAHAVKAHDYDTAYIGKWHLDGPQRYAFTPPERRGGFDYWAGFGSMHRYFDSFYYRDDPTPIPYGDYEPKVQTQQVIEYLQERDTEQPFCLFLSYGPPHNPYDQVPDEYRNMYSVDSLVDRPNFMNEYIRSNPEVMRQYDALYHDVAWGEKGPGIHRGVSPDFCRDEICGYYAHMTAMDEYVGQILQTLKDTGLDEDTIFVFMSDHGDMLGSHRLYQKQWPHDESVCIPFLVRYPRVLTEAREVSQPLNMVDVVPTLLGLAGLAIPDTVEGTDLSHCAKGESHADDPDAALITCPSPFLSDPNWGMREYRGVRTARYTYTRCLQGPWHLFDNELDPYQLENLVNQPAYAEVQRQLDDRLSRFLEETDDDFQPAEVHRHRAGVYVVKDDDAIPFMTDKGIPARQNP